MRVRLSVVFEGHCFSPLKSSLAVSGIICRQVFGYLKDFDEKMTKKISDILNRLRTNMLCLLFCYFWRLRFNNRWIVCLFS